MELLHRISSCIVFIVISVGHFAIADLSLKSGVEYMKSQAVKNVCSNVNITDRQGVINSPNYPSSYSNHLSCSWHISGNIGDVIVLWFDDIDIEALCLNRDRPCCFFNWLKVGSLTNSSEMQLCGKNLKYGPVESESHKLLIKFHISKFAVGGRGFLLHYKITPRVPKECQHNEYMCGTGQCISLDLKCDGRVDCKDATDELDCIKPALIIDCKPDEIKCGNNKCISRKLACNGFPDCEDASDETFCLNKCPSGLSCDSILHCYNESQRCDGKRDCVDYSDEWGCGPCAGQFVRCGPNSTQCYKPATQKCDRYFNCLNGADEMDCMDACPGQIACNNRLGCYFMKHRCNGVAQCGDASDEKDCVPELCNYEEGEFLCDNQRCIKDVWTCDGTDDCGDGSDERNCLRNSVLTAAVMGSLICALLLVIAISCTCRLHALRMLERRLSSRETPLSRMSREFFFREPPPSYAVAVGSRHENLYIENNHYCVPVHRNRRSRRRPRRGGSVVVPQLPSVPRSCVLLNPNDVVPRVEPGDVNSNGGESSNSVPISDSALVVRPGIKNECLKPFSQDNQNVCKVSADDKDVVQPNSVDSTVVRARSDSDSLSLELVNSNLVIEETSDSAQNALSDHYCCDSDSEQLVP